MAFRGVAQVGPPRGKPLPMTSPTPLQLLASTLFALAILHTFLARHFERLAHRHPRHAGLWHLLGEIEIVFGVWEVVLVVAMFALLGQRESLAYLESRNYTEPMFVFAIMVIAASRPVLQLADGLVRRLAGVLPMPAGTALVLCVLSVVPLLGSFITEPAAMTVAALMLRQTLFAAPISTRLQYAALAVLFVNISIGGTLTPFAAPPVLMVAGVWGWDMAFMLTHFGWKAALAVGVNAVGLVWLFRRELASLSMTAEPPRITVPAALVGVHLLFLAGVVVFAHHPVVFIGLFLLFMGVVTAYREHQDRLILREALLVAFFLAGLVVLGGLQAWWLQPLLMGMSEDAVFFGAAALTAITDNAALTYLGSLVEGLSPEFQVALVAGAVAGGGLTVIANAPNPAGVAILRDQFPDGAVRAGALLLAALPPTAVALLVLRLPSL